MGDFILKYWVEVLLTAVCSFVSFTYRKIKKAVKFNIGMYIFDVIQATNNKQMYICHPIPLVFMDGSKKYNTATPIMDNQICINAK